MNKVNQFNVQPSWNILHFLFQYAPQQTTTKKQKQAIKPGHRPQVFESNCQA